MKQVAVTLSILFVVVAFSSLINIGATAVTVGLPTITTMDAGQTVTFGTSQTINISITEPSNDLTPIGRVDFFELQKSVSLGQRQYLQSVSMSQPEIKWTAGSNYNISGFRLPTISTQISQYTEWTLKEDGNTVAVGQISFVEAETMQETTDSLWILFGSGQTDGNVYTSPYFSLKIGKNYSLILNSKAYSNSFTFPNGAVGSPTLTDVETNVTYSYSFDLMLAISRESHTESLKSFSIQWVPKSLGTSWLISSYTGMQSLFLPSINITNVEIMSSSNALVNFPPVTAMQTSTVTLSASFEIDGLPLTQASTEFYMMRDSFWTKVGQTKTDYGGIASISLGVDFPLGNYPLKALVIDGSIELVGLSELTVIQPTAEFQVSYSTGYFGTGLSPNSSVVDIIGSLRASWGVPLEGHEVLLYRNDGSLISSATTDSVGGFDFQYTFTGPAGIYPSEVYLVHNSSIFITSNFWIDVTIQKGTPQILVEDVAYAEFLNESISIGGTIVKPNGLPLEATLTMQYYDLGAEPSPRWIDIASLSTQSGDFDFYLQNPGVGTFQYRFVYAGDPNFNQVQKTVQLMVNKSIGAVMSIDGSGSSQNPVEVYYNHGGDFLVNITSSNGKAISNAKITVLSPSLNGSSTFDLIVTGYSDANGIFQFSWLPPESYEDPAIALKLSGINPYLIFQVTHDNFTVPDKRIYWEFFGLNISASLVPKTYYYSFTQTIDFALIDDFGLAVKDGSVLSLNIDGTQLFQSVSGGVVSFTFTFSKVGLLNLQLVYSSEFSSIGFPYGDLSINFTISINSADVDLFTSNYNSLQGQTISLYTISKNMQGTLLQDVTVELWYFIGIWRKVPTPVLITNSSGMVEYNYFVDLPTVGQYSFEWRVIGDGYFRSTAIGFTVEVTGIITDLQLTGPAEYDFSEVQYVSASLQTSLNISLDNKIIHFKLGSYSWTEVTGIDGSVSTQLPLGLLPGTYELSASYEGDTTYQGSNSSYMLTILGVNTLISINDLPPNAIFAESFNFTVQLTDESNNPLANQGIRILVNGETHVGITDAFGKYFFNEVYFGNETAVTLEVFFDGQAGYNSSSNAVMLDVIKHALGVNVNLSDFVFGQNATIKVEVNSTKGGDVVGALVNLYVDGNYLANGTTNENGFFEFVWLHQRNAGSLMSLRIVVLHDNFTKASSETTITVKRAALQAILDNNGFYFLTNSTVGVTIVDMDGTPVPDLLVTISYNYGLQNFILGQHLTDLNGFVQTWFLPPQIGTVDILYTVEDQNGNYLQLQGKSSFNIQAASAIVNSSITSSMNFEAGILATVTLSTTLPIDVTVTLEVFVDGSWLYVTNSTTFDGKVMFSIPPSFSNSSSVVFRTSIAEYGIMNTSATLTANFTSVTILTENAVIESHDIFSPQVLILTPSGSLEYYYLEIYVKDTVTNSSIFWGNVFYLNGTYLFIENGTFFNSIMVPLTSTEVEALLSTVNFQISASDWLSSLADTGLLGNAPIADFPIGDYSVQIIFPSQGWYSKNSTWASLTVEPEKIIIGAEAINVQNDPTVLIEIPVNENEGTPVNGGEVVVQVKLNGEWQIIGRGDIVQGSASIEINSTLPFGTFPLRYMVPKYSYYAIAVVEKEITISRATELIYVGSTDLTIVYSDGISLTFQLRLKGTSVSLEGQTVILSVFENDDLVDQYFGTTNSTGYVVFENVMTGLIPGHEYMINVRFEGSNVLSPADFDLSSARITRDEVNILQIPELSRDFGPTANQTIAVTVADESSIIQSGSLYWVVYYKNAAGVWLPLQGMSGFIAIEDQNPVIFVFNMTGEYQLHIEYVNDNPYYVANEGLVIPFGWMDEMAEIKNTSFQFQFPSSGNLTIETYIETPDGNPLVGITVELWTPFGNFSAMSGQGGIVTFVIWPNSSGTMNITFYIPQQLSIVETIVPGTLEITLVEREFIVSVDDVYWDEFIILTVDDPLANSSTYDVTFLINDVEVLHLENLTYLELISPIQLKGMEPSTVTYNVTRTNSYTMEKSTIGTFNLLPVPVRIDISHTVSNGSAIVQVSIFDTRTDEPIMIPYVLTVVNASDSFTITMEKHEFTIPSSTNTTLTVTLSGRYVGMETIEVVMSPAGGEGVSQKSSFMTDLPPDLYAILSLALGGTVLVVIQKRRTV